MAIGNYIGTLGGLAGFFKGFTGKVGKWLGVAGAGGVATETLTNSDGKGGVLTNPLRTVTQTPAIEASRLQAVDSLFDMVSGASNGVTTFVSGTLASLLEVIAHFTGSKMMADWASQCRSFEQRSQDVHSNRADLSRENGTDGNLGAPGLDPTIPAKDDSSFGVNTSPTGLAISGVAGTTAALLARSALKSPVADVDGAAKKAVDAVDDAVDGPVLKAAEKGVLGKLFSKAASFKGNAVIMGGLALGTGAYSFFGGSSPAQAAEDAAGVVGYDETIQNAREGNYEEATHSATVATTSLVGGILGGAWAGAAAGGAAGTVVPFVGNAAGAIVGGIGGAIVGSGIGSYVGEAAYSAGSWAVNGISSLFNGAANDTAPAKAMPAPRITINEPQWATPII